jgi:DNA-binding MarR family transcriptional regulator
LFCYLVDSNNDSQGQRFMEFQAERLMIVLREIAECCREGEEIQARAHDLTPSEARALVAIKFQRCATTADLADALFVGKSRVTRILDGLVRKGLMERSEHSDDRRLCTIRLTADGRKVTTKLLTFVRRLHEDVLSLLPPDSQTETLESLSRLKEAMHSVRARLREGDLGGRRHERNGR